MFFSNNMREIISFKSSDGNKVIWYIRSLNEDAYIITCSYFRGILTQKFIFGYTIQYDVL